MLCNGWLKNIWVLFRYFSCRM